jgi:hypothetical protein
VLTIRLSARERRIVLAALRYFRRRLYESLSLEDMARVCAAYSEVQSLEPSESGERLPSRHELENLESRLSGKSTPDGDAGMWTVVVLRGGLLDSLYVTPHESVFQKRFDETCRSLRLHPHDPYDEHFEVYHDGLVRQDDEYLWE